MMTDVRLIGFSETGADRRRALQEFFPKPC